MIRRYYNITGANIWYYFSQSREGVQSTGPTVITIFPNRIRFGVQVTSVASLHHAYNDWYSAVNASSSEYLLIGAVEPTQPLQPVVAAESDSLISDVALSRSWTTLASIGGGAGLSATNVPTNTLNPPSSDLISAVQRARDTYSAHTTNFGTPRMSSEMPTPRNSSKPTYRLSPLWVEYEQASLLVEPIGTCLNKKGFQKIASDAIIGIEFENEISGEVPIPFHDKFSVASDNSLRGQGVEWVLRKPDEIPVVRAAYKELLPLIKKAKANNSERASTHVHFDVTKMNYFEVLTFSMCYFLAEELLSQFAGESRQNNLFCLRLVDSKRITYELSTELNTKNPFSSNLFNDSFRYAALNFSAVNKFGSLEFRLFPAVTSTTDLDVWIDTLNNIRLFSLNFSSFASLNKYLIEEDMGIVLEKMLGKEELQHILSQLKKRSIDKEVLSWSRSAYCSIAQILLAKVTIPSLSEVKALKKAAEADEKERQDTLTKKIEEANKYSFTYPESRAETDQLRQMTRSTSAVENTITE